MTLLARTTRPHRKYRRWMLASWIALASFGSAHAADIEVTSTGDSGTGSLREALTNAADGDRIVFNIPGGGASTITLASDLPGVTSDVTFSNPAPGVNIDLNGKAPLTFLGSTVDPTGLKFNTVVGSNDISATVGSRIFGDDSVFGNVKSTGTIAPGAIAGPGSVGTLTVQGDLDASNATLEFDINGNMLAEHDRVQVLGTTTLTGATLQPVFRGSKYEIGDMLTVLQSTGPINGMFSNTGPFQLPNNPFLIADETVNPNDVQLSISDNMKSYVDVVTGCNSIATAESFDQLRMGGSLPADITALRNGSTQQVTMAVNQLSGAIYANLLDAEIQHMQMNVGSIRDRIVMQLDHPVDLDVCKTWARGYGIDGKVGVDDCLTQGYSQRTGGIELGVARVNASGFAVHGFADLANSNLNNGDAGQDADIGSYRGGGAVQYVGDVAYVVGMAGGGGQTYDVHRSLSAVPGSSFVESSFSGLSRYGYLELGKAVGAGSILWLPHVGLQSLYTDLDSVRESGDADFGLNVNASDRDSLRSLVGIDVQKSGPTELGPATTRLRLGWFHEYLDNTSTLANQFQNTNATTPFRSRSVNAGSDWASVGVQLDWGTIWGGRLSGGYQGFYNSDTTFHLGSIGSTWWF